MSKGGSIILNGSAVSVKGFPAFSVYSATKAAVRSFARVWTTDLKDLGIRVNVVSPGPIATPGAITMMGGSRDALDGFAGVVPQGDSASRRRLPRQLSTLQATIQALSPESICSWTEAWLLCKQLEGRTSERPAPNPQRTQQNLRFCSRKISKACRQGLGFLQY